MYTQVLVTSFGSASAPFFVEAVLYRYRSSIPWRDLPKQFGDFRVVHTRFSHWAKSGVWQRVFEALAEEADNEYAIIDSSIVRAHQHSAGAKGGCKQRSNWAEQRGLNTKIQAVVDALGNPISFHLTLGQACDLEGVRMCCYPN